MSSARRRRYGVVTSWNAPNSASARFAAALADSLSGQHEIARIVSSTSVTPSADPTVSRSSPRPLTALADELNRCDVAIIHHSVDHDEPLNRDVSTGLTSGVLDVIDLLGVPTIVVLHHVP